MNAAPCFFVQTDYADHLTAPVSEFARKYNYPLIERAAPAGFNAADCGVDWPQFTPVLPYGSPQFLRQLREVPHLQPFVLQDEQKFSAAEWETRLGPAMLNHSGGQVSVSGASALLSIGRYHVRPDAADNAFPAQIYDRASWAATRAERNLHEDLLCWVSPVRTIKREWRCWIVGGIVVEYCQFREGGKPVSERKAPGAVFNLASRIGSTWLPAATVVVDIAETAEGLQVVGFTPIHSAAWHGVDISEVLAVWMGWARWYYSERAQTVSKLIGAA